MGKYVKRQLSYTSSEKAIKLHIEVVPILVGFKKY